MPNCVAIYGHSAPRHQLYMPLMEHGNLRKALYNRRVDKMRLVTQSLAGILNGIVHLHGQRVALLGTGGEEALATLGRTLSPFPGKKKLDLALIPILLRPPDIVLAKLSCPALYGDASGPFLL